MTFTNAYPLPSLHSIAIIIVLSFVSRLSIPSKIYIFFDAHEKVISRLVTFQRSIEHTRLNSSSEERIVLRRLTRFVWRREGRKEGERRTFKFQFDVTGKGRRAMSRRRKLAQVQIGGLVPWVPHRLLIRYSNQNT